MDMLSGGSEAVPLTEFPDSFEGLFFLLVHEEELMGAGAPLHTCALP